MIKWLTNQQANQGATEDPFLELTKLFIRIDKREKVTPRVQKEDVCDEDNKRSASRTFRKNK